MSGMTNQFLPKKNKPVHNKQAWKIRGESDFVALPKNMEEKKN